MERYGDLVTLRNHISCLKPTDQSLQYEVKGIQYAFNLDGNSAHLNGMDFCNNRMTHPHLLEKILCYVDSKKDRNSTSKENKLNLKSD
jgi:hypothetical protein